MDASEASSGDRLCATMRLGVLHDSCAMTASDGPVSALDVLPMAGFCAADAQVIRDDLAVHEVSLLNR